jgi:hypothetical protein
MNGMDLVEPRNGVMYEKQGRAYIIAGMQQYV